MAASQSEDKRDFENTSKSRLLFLFRIISR